MHRPVVVVDAIVVDAIVVVDVDASVLAIVAVVVPVVKKRAKTKGMDLLIRLYSNIVVVARPMTEIALEKTWTMDLELLLLLLFQWRLPGHY